MFTFRWTLPGERKHELTLNVYSSRSWFGRKEVLLDGQRVVRRRRTEGVFCRLWHPETGERLELRLLPVADRPVWRPALFCDGREIPQTGGTPPPVLNPPPRAIATTAAIVYVAMLMSLTSGFAIVDILNSLNLNHDDLRVAVTVLPAVISADELRIEPPRFPALEPGQPFEGQLQAFGGAPPYHWTAEKSGWTRGIELDANTGRLHGTPLRPGDISGVVEVHDSHDTDDDGDGAIDAHTAKIAFSAYVRRSRDDQPGAIRIREPDLPLARAGEPFEYRFIADGGRPAPGEQEAVVRWTKGRKTSLPEGLKLDGETGVLHGVPKKPESRPLVIRAYDLSYKPMHDVLPWAAPFVTTALCLIGYLTMRRVAVVVFAALIAVQVAAHVSGIWSSSLLALALETIVWAVGAAYWKKMN
ncbi:MAG: hypothetical protein D6744_00080 [Planctomycetota bacterium]|nr:MAG: hypothetical protein D6744_00080 [Planctomycetota bacterium]